MQFICQSNIGSLKRYTTLWITTDDAKMNDEHAILNHYNLTNPFPTAWPAEKDETDASEEENTTRDLSNTAIRQSRSRYSALQRIGSDRRSLIPGSQRLRDGHENLVQKDEPDPLGATDSVVRVLRQRGLPVEEDQRLSEDSPSCNEHMLIAFREQIPPILYHLFPESIPITGPSKCFNPIFAARSRVSLPIY